MDTGNITTDDLKNFRRELLEEIRKMLSEQQAEPRQRWFKSYQLKNILPLSHNKIQQLRDSGKLPHAKFGRVLIYDYYDIEKVVSEHKLIAQEAIAVRNKK